MGISCKKNVKTLKMCACNYLTGEGIDYTNNLFRYSDGSTRIVKIWDQTIRDGTPPNGILYGSEYTSEDINQALSSENPYGIVPSRDENGHGTFLAGVACGNENAANNFIGAAPNSQIVVVKLKEAKQYLKEFYLIPDGVPVYQENDIMMAVAYLNRIAADQNQPLVLCISLGSSIGSRGNSGGPLGSYLSYICTRRKRAVVTATGNEANSRHHFSGRITSGMEYEDVEVTVEEDMNGFFMELWAAAPELFAVSIISPTGEEIPRVPVRSGVSQVFQFVFEGTTVSVDYKVEANENAGQLIFFRFEQAKRGLWTIRVYPQSIITGVYHVYLPMRQMTYGNVFFLRSNPDSTITLPGITPRVITVGGYNAADGSIFSDSGRGFTITGEIKPDFAAPAVNIDGPGLRNNFVTFTGTSAAAAITAGACAQIMQWALVDQQNVILSNAGLKNMLIRGTRRMENRAYPNREWGADGIIVSS